MGSPVAVVAAVVVFTVAEVIAVVDVFVVVGVVGVVEAAALVDTVVCFAQALSTSAAIINKLNPIHKNFLFTIFSFVPLLLIKDEKYRLVLLWLEEFIDLTLLRFNKY